MNRSTTSQPTKRIYKWFLVRAKVGRSELKNWGSVPIVRSQLLPGSLRLLHELAEITYGNIVKLVKASS